MAHRFWRSETFRVWLQYFAAGVAMVPVGVTYVALIGRFGERRALNFSLALAVVVGLITWTCVGRLLRSHFSKPMAVRATNTISNKTVQCIYADKTSLEASDLYPPHVIQGQYAWTTLSAGLR